MRSEASSRVARGMADRTSKGPACSWLDRRGWATTVVRAVAADMGWSVIELNASTTATAAIRRAATHGATTVRSSRPNDPPSAPSFFDEVDHLSSGCAPSAMRASRTLMTTRTRRR